MKHSVVDVFLTFLKLGLTSFGGPIAHIAYFRHELVERRNWISESQFAQLFALSQFLPGPASSQLGFILGWHRAGGLGALAAFTAFTLPSAILLILFAWSLVHLNQGWGEWVIHALKLVAVVVIAQGILGMLKQLCPDKPRIAIATIAVVTLLLLNQAWVQIAVVILGGFAGWLWCQHVKPTQANVLPHIMSRKISPFALGLFFILLLGLPLLANAGQFWALFDAFFRAGALVFGGGHVVLPLLEESIAASGWLSADEFLAGYGAAQAIPGPMFTFAAYLGTRIAELSLLGAFLALVAIFLPGFLLVIGVLPWWQQLSAHPLAARIVAGVNAAVVGILGAALYDPVWTSAVLNSQDMAIVVSGLALALVWRLSALWIVLWCVTSSVLMNALATFI